MEQPSHRTRPLLLQLILSLPGLTFWSLSVVTFGSVRSDDPGNRLVDLIQPVQSYLSHVADSFDILNTDDAAAHFFALETTFGGNGLADTYVPWLRVDLFGRASILSELDPAGQYSQGPKLDELSRI